MKTNLTKLIAIALLMGSYCLKAQIFDITSFGALADGKTLATTAIQAAIDKASVVGGKVYVPAGTYYAGSIFLKDNVTLELAAGATLLASTNIKDYTPVRWGHHEDRTPWHFVVALNVKNVRITGMGTIDGNGMSYWEPKRKHDWSFYKETEMRPSPMVEIDGCERVIVENVTIQNSAGWGLHLLNSTDVKCLGLTIKNNPFGPNSDGIDVTGCRQVVIGNCNIDVGDDAIALKTTEDSGPCEYVSISNCNLSTNCVALRIGFESRKDFRYITASNLVVRTASRIVDVRSVEGCVIEHVNISNVVGTTNSGWPINRVVEMEVDTVFTPYSVEIPEHPNYHKPKPIGKLGAIRDVRFSNFSIVTDGRFMMAAAPGMEMSQIKLDNIHLDYAMIDEPSPLADKAKSLGFFRNMKDVRTAKAAIVAKNIGDLSVSGVTIKWPTYPVPSDWNLLKTEWRFLNKEWYQGNEDAIREGKKRSPFSAFWGKELRNPQLKLENLTASEPGLKAVMVVR